MKYTILGGYGEYKTDKDLVVGSSIEYKNARLIVLPNYELCPEQDCGTTEKGEKTHWSRIVDVGGKLYMDSDPDIGYCAYTNRLYLVSALEKDNNHKRVERGYASEHLYKHSDSFWYTIPQKGEPFKEGDTENPREGIEDITLSVDKVKGLIDEVAQEAAIYPRQKEISLHPLSDKILRHLSEYYHNTPKMIPPVQFYTGSLWKEEFELEIANENIRGIIQYIKDRAHNQAVVLNANGKPYYLYDNFTDIQRKNQKLYATYDKMYYQERGTNSKITKMTNQRVSSIITSVGGDPNTVFQELLGYKEKFWCVWGNTIDHKEQFIEVQSILNTCQKGQNNRSLGAGRGNAFTNGYLQPLLLYKSKGGEFVGRLMIREMRNEKGKIIHVIDRLYSSDGKLGSKKTYLYKALTEKLLSRGRRVAIPTKSVHEKSLHYYLSLEKTQRGIRYRRNAGGLETGLYKCVKIDGQYVGYYNDSQTSTAQTILEKKVRHFDRLILENYKEIQSFINLLDQDGVRNQTKDNIQGQGENEEEILGNNGEANYNPERRPFDRASVPIQVSYDDDED